MKFKVFSLGCKVNSYETSAITSDLISHGFILDNDNPDVVIINTCSVTATADQKSRQHIRKFQKLYPNSIVVVMGCYSQGNKDYILENIKPTILIGTSHRNEIYNLIQEYLKNKKPIVKIDDNPRFFSYEELGVTSFSENTRAYLKIQDGCDNFCAYCLIPFRRGKSRSRLPEHVLQEARYLIEKGYQEIVLTGIHVGGYGKDFGNYSFSDLVENLLNLPNCPRLRISSIEESEIDDKLVTLVNSNKKLCNHLHIPLQSGCDSTLKRMNRKYTTAEFKHKLDDLKEKTNALISTDVIVGFPGETDEEFEQTVEFIKDSGINMIHVFPFSSREGTLASRMPNQIDPRIKNQRVDVLLELSKQLFKEYYQKFIGQEVEVLIEKIDKDNNSIGHTTNYIEVVIPHRGKVGETITVKLQENMIVSK